jgi:hypothetical protein
MSAVKCANEVVSCYGLQYETLQFGRGIAKFWIYVLSHCTLKKEAVVFFETLVPAYQTAWSHNSVSISEHVYKYILQFSNIIIVVWYKR